MSSGEIRAAIASCEAKLENTRAKIARLEEEIETLETYHTKRQGL